MERRSLVESLPFCALLLSCPCSFPAPYMQIMEGRSWEPSRTNRVQSFPMRMSTWKANRQECAKHKDRSRGYCTFPLVPVGTYTLTVHAQGFKPVAHEGVVVSIHSVVEQDLELTVGEQTQTITVTDSEVQVETAETELGETLGSERSCSVRSMAAATPIFFQFSPVLLQSAQAPRKAVPQEAALLRQPRPPAVSIRDSFQSAVSEKAQMALFSTAPASLRALLRRLP